MNSNEWAEAMIELNGFLEELKDKGIAKSEILQEVDNVFNE